MTARPKFRVADGYRLCREIGDGRCGCEQRGQRPCDTLKPVLHAAQGDVAFAVELERERIAAGKHPLAVYQMAAEMAANR